MPGKAKATITRKVTPLRLKLEKDLLAAATECGCTSGKWMLFPTVQDVDYVWSRVAKGTAEGELGIAAKVAAADDEGEIEGGKRRLICVYTKDFGDADDVKRVLLGLKGMGFLRGEDGGEGRGIYYKCGEWYSPVLGGVDGVCGRVLTYVADAFTHLGINSGNEWGIKASLFSSKDILGNVKKE